MEESWKDSKGVSIVTPDLEHAVVAVFQDPSLNFYVVNNFLTEYLCCELTKKMEKGCLHCVLNFENVSIMDSCGVGLIIAIKKLVDAHGCKLYLTSIKSNVAKIFEILRFGSYFEFFDTEDGALQAAQKVAPTSL